MEKLVNEIVTQIKNHISAEPKIALILGSGLSEIVDVFEDKQILQYNQINGMPHTNVKGHKNQFVFGKINNKQVVAIQGRFHFYSGFSTKETVLPIYILKKLGVETLIVTNSAGATSKKYNVGDIMLITDHINLTGQNPLIGGTILPNEEQFLDMTNAYNLSYINKLKKIAKDQKIKVKQGVYAQFTGPSYETPSEVKFARKIGANAVGMSTALEVISARDCNIKVLGISSISNLGAGVDNKKMTHADVLSISRATSSKITQLITNFIKEI